MCRYLTLLAKSSDIRYIAQCEHSTIHLVWHHATLQFRSADVCRLASVITHWNSSEAPTSLSDSFIRLFRLEQGGTQLWLGGIGLYLALQDLPAFAEMLQAAAVRLADATIGAMEGKQTEHPERYAELWVTPGDICCVN